MRFFVGWVEDWVVAEGITIGVEGRAAAAWGAGKGLPEEFVEEEACTGSRPD